MRGTCVVVALYMWLCALPSQWRAVEADCVKKGPCSCQSPDGLIDLSPLDGHGSPRFKDRPATGSDTNLYSWNPCSPFSEQPQCQDVAGCQVTSDRSMSYSLGTQDSATFSESGGAVSVQYSAQDPSSYVTRTLVVSLECHPDAIPGSLEVAGELVTLSYVMTLKSCYCCPGASCQSGGGISVGSVLLIVFFSLLIVYVVAGVLYMKFVKKSEGKELIPNHSFWTALPGLVKDGALYTFRRVSSLCGRRGSYEKV
ncbi:cation-dependent mannose-6-phosphate receptor-like [Babylonia areolata]|uniref:cation-dependent mannose-6-phosphate receptor-like n=1 Tax=Babylonia areolata TaxID=304850 RepID=UPI003FD4A622